MIPVFCCIVQQFYERARLLCSRTHHQEEALTVEMHVFCCLTLLVVPHIVDQLLQYELALV